ncbi:MAG: fatty acid desaturase [Myxococcales bacterium]
MPAWVSGLRRYEAPSSRRAAWQLSNTVVPYLLLFFSLMEALRRGAPAGVSFVLAVGAGGFLVRLFGLFHDCVHGSFVADQRLCRLIGVALGVLVLTPFGNWRYFHLAHHATAADLDRRNTGDIWTLTVDEYWRAPRWQRFKYRVFRSPAVMFGLGPLVLFLLIHRLPGSRPSRARIVSALGTDAALLVVAMVLGSRFGLRAYLLAQLSVLLVGATAGVWLFYVQHQFSPSYWSRHGEWSPLRAALEGSSYYKLPKVLQWFSASIGLHHVHHLRPRMPNYHLQRCLDATPELRRIPPLTVRRSLAALRFRLWDERADRFVGFSAVRGQTQPRSLSLSQSTPGPRR